MIDVHIFAIDKFAKFYVVSTYEAIRDLCVFTENHHAHGNLYADGLYKRILFHNAYCCVIPETLSGRLSTMSFKSTLKKRGRLINIDAYMEAFILANPEEAASVLSVPIADLVEIAKESDWALVFEVDKDEIVERLNAIK